MQNSTSLLYTTRSKPNLLSTRGPMRSTEHSLQRQYWMITLCSSSCSMLVTICALETYLMLLTAKFSDDSSLHK